MARGRTRTHLDDSKPGQPLRRALCSWLDVDTTTDLSLVTCKCCLELLAGGRKTSGARQASRRAPGQAEVASELAKAFQATLAPKAGPPPTLSPALWAASCKGADTGRCRSEDCVLCTWDREAQLWSAVAPWAKEMRLDRPESAPRWGSLAAALVALVEHERHGRHGPSAFGGILRRIEMGEVGDGGKSRPDDPLLRRAGELVRVRQALDAAYPDGAHRLSASARKTLLLARTPGVLTAMPTYEQLAEELGESIGELRALVRSGREAMTWALAERGLIPPPREPRRRVPCRATMELAR